MAADVGGSSSQLTQSSKPSENIKKSNGERSNRPQDKKNLEDKFKSLSVHEDIKFQSNRVVPSGEPPSKRQISTNPSALTTSSVVQNSPHRAASRTQSDDRPTKNNGRTTTTAPNKECTKSSARTSSTRQSLKVSQGGVVKGGGARSSGPSKDKTPEDAPSDAPRDSEAMARIPPSRRRYYDIRIVVHRRPLEAQDWALVLHRGGRNNITSDVVDQGARWGYRERRGAYPNGNGALADVFAAELETCDVDFYLDVIQHADFEQQGYLQSERWCWQALEDLRDLGLIAINLNDVAERVMHELPEA